MQATDSGTRNPEPGTCSWRSPALLLLLGCLAALTAAGLLGMDQTVERAVHDHLPRALHLTAEWISLLGLSGCYVIAALVLLFWSWQVRPNRWLWRACLWLLTAEAACCVVVRTLKIVFGRWRPDRPLAGHFEFFRLSPKCHSFPSGHTADAFVVATVLWFAFPRLRPLCVAWALLMALSRICAMQHFVADAAAGAALGILCALAVGRRLGAIERWLSEHAMPAPV